MIERTPLLNLATYAVMFIGALVVFVPLWLVFVGATLTVREINTPELHYITGSHLFENLQAAWARGNLGGRLLNSLIMSLGVATG